MKSLKKKRLEALFTLAGYVASGSTAAFVPTPCGEVPKQLALTASDVLMYAGIWKIYFEDDLAHQDLLSMLTEIGLITVASAGTAYIVARGTTAVVKEITEWGGVPAWGVSAAIAGSLTSLFGLAWLLYCDRLCSQKSVRLNQLPR